MRKRETAAGMILGLAAAGSMLFAYQLGLDNNTAWGSKRIILFLIGVIIFVTSLSYREDNFIGRLFNSKRGRLYLAATIAGSGIILVYAWWVSLGLWTNWPATTNYYDLLATAFGHGQLALEVEPDPALLALADPYIPDNRQGIPVLWDASLYESKYYLYWGPAPALVLTLVKLFYAKEIGDNLLTFAFITGMFVFLALILLEIKKNYFSQTPRRVVIFGIMLGGLINPILFVLVNPRVYEAAVASGQFFFTGGLYWLFTAFNRPSIPRLALAGIFFALAVGSRTILVLPVAFLTLVVLIWAVKANRAKTFAFIPALALPLALGAAGYAWYNYARFGSVAEFGYSYQLTGFNIHETAGQTFSLAYIPLNLFKTLLNPFETKTSFPFIRPTLWAGPSWFYGYRPKIYYLLAESITGILVGSPFLVFAFIAGLRKKQDINWISTSLIGSTLLIFLTLQIFFYTTMRYLLDLVPALTLLAVTGFWQGLHLLKPRRPAQYLFAILGAGLWAYTILVSFLLAFSSNLQRFRTLNPELIQQLTWTFNNMLK